jgi:hypothetical protein
LYPDFRNPLRLFEPEEKKRREPTAFERFMGGVGSAGLGALGVVSNAVTSVGTTALQTIDTVTQPRRVVEQLGLGLINELRGERGALMHGVRGAAQVASFGIFGNDQVMDPMKELGGPVGLAYSMATDPANLLGGAGVALRGASLGARAAGAAGMASRLGGAATTARRGAMALGGTLLDDAADIGNLASGAARRVRDYKTYPSYRAPSDELIARRVEVYRNLNVDEASTVYSLRDAKTGKVLAHVDNVDLADVDFKVGESGRQKVLQTKTKNVHAFVIGTVRAFNVAEELPEGGKAATYNPFKYDSFVLKDDPTTKLQTAQTAFLGKGGVTAYAPNERSATHSTNRGQRGQQRLGIFLDRAKEENLPPLPLFQTAVDLEKFLLDQGLKPDAAKYNAKVADARADYWTQIVPGRKKADWYQQELPKQLAGRDGFLNFPDDILEPDVSAPVSTLRVDWDEAGDVARKRHKLFADPAPDGLPKVGRPKNAPMRFVKRDKKGEIVDEMWVGDLPQEAWAAQSVGRILRLMDPKAAVQWYETLDPAFQQYLGAGFSWLNAKGDRVAMPAQTHLVPWALSQQATSPAGGMQGYFRMLDKERFGEEVYEGSGTLGAPRIKPFLEGDIGAAADTKLTDFVDSSLLRLLRSYFGNDPKFGQPAGASDIWAGLGAGFITPSAPKHLSTARFELEWKNPETGQIEYINPLEAKERKLFRKDYDVKPGMEYEFINVRLSDLAQRMTDQQFMGLSEVLPRGAQAADWTALRDQLGQNDADPLSMFKDNIRRVAAELAPGAGSPLEQAYPGWGSLSFDEQRTVTERVLPSLIGQAAEESGVKIPGYDFSKGGYAPAGGGVTKSPNSSIQVLGSPEAIQDFATLMGHYANQTEVLVSRPMPKSGATDSLVIVGEGLEDAVEDIMRDAASKHPLLATGFSITPTDDGREMLVLLDLEGKWVDAKGKRSAKLRNELLEILQASSQKYGRVVDDAESGVSAHDVQRIVNDWKENPRGEDYARQALASNRTHIQAALERHPGGLAADRLKSLLPDLEQLHPGITERLTKPFAGTGVGGSATPGPGAGGKFDLVDDAAPTGGDPLSVVGQPLAKMDNNLPIPTSTFKGGRAKAYAWVDDDELQMLLKGEAPDYFTAYANDADAPAMGGNLVEVLVGGRTADGSKPEVGQWLQGADVEASGLGSITAGGQVLIVNPKAIDSVTVLSADDPKLDGAEYLKQLDGESIDTKRLVPGLLKGGTDKGRIPAAHLARALRGEPEPEEEGDLREVRLEREEYEEPLSVPPEQAFSAMRALQSELVLRKMQPPEQMRTWATDYAPRLAQSLGVTPYEAFELIRMGVKGISQ